MAPTDSDRPEAGHPPDAPGHGDGVGTVAEEAARLVELLAGPDGPLAAARAAATRDRTAEARRGGTSHNGTSHNGTSDNATSRAETPPDGGPHDSEPASGVGAGGTDHRCTCGGSTPQACRLCPVCQFIALVGSISPETIERAADVVGLAATALRDLAVVQRERQAARDARPPADGGRT